LWQFDTFLKTFHETYLPTDVETLWNGVTTTTYLEGGFLVVNVPKLLVYSKTFRFVLGTFQKCCGTLRCFHMFWNFQFTPKHSDLFWGQFKIVLENVLEKFQDCSENIQICFWDISKVFQNIKTFSKVFRNILTCLVDCPVFIMFQNF